MEKKTPGSYRHYPKIQLFSALNDFKLTYVVYAFCIFFQANVTMSHLQSHFAMSKKLLYTNEFLFQMA